MTEKWYDKTIEQIANKLQTDLRNGLDQKIAGSRLKKRGGNVIYPIPKASFRSYLKHIITDFISILLILTAAVAAVFHEPVSAAVIIGVLLLNYSAAIFTYVKAQRILEGMGQYGLPVTKVVRGGKLYLVRQEQLVPGDVIYLSVGDIIPCDARILEVNDLAVLETAVTSVAGATEKDASFIEFRDISPSAQKNMLFASTIITRGTAKAVAVLTGSDTLVCKMGKNNPIVSHDDLRIHEVLKKYCGVWSLVMMASVFALTVLDIIVGKSERSLFDIFLTGLSLAVSSMSELYTAFGFIIIGCGIFNAVKQYRDLNVGALIKNSSRLESLKDITCLIVPKEGVFSVNDMKAEHIYANSNNYALGDNKFIDNCARTIRYALLSTALYGGSKLIENNIKNNNIYSPEEEAIIALASEYGIYNVGLDREYPILDHLSMSDESLFETTLVSYSGAKVLAARGEINRLLERCRYYCENGRVYPLTADKLDDIKSSAAKLTRESYRVVGVASKDTIFSDLSRLALCQNELTFEGFIALREPLLPRAAKNVSKCRAAGIKVIMLCDDVSENNRYLAETVGVARNATDIITSDEIKEMKEGLFRANLSIYSVYQGLSVSQKRDLVRYLKEDGKVVGVLARQLDEMPLLRDGDVGFSQSVTLSGKSKKGGVDITGRNIPVFSQSPRASAVSGCEALKFISDVIISVADKAGRGGFNAIINAISFAKVIYLNLLRMVRYLIVSQIARGFVVLYSVLTKNSLLTPLQILFCGLIVDFLAVIIIAFERPSSDILKNKINAEEKLTHPLTYNIESVVLGLLWGAGSVILPQILRDLNIISTTNQALTCAFISLILTQIIILNETMREKSIFIPNVKINGINLLVTGALVAFIIICSVFKSAGEIFGVVPIGWMAWLAVISLPLLVLIIYEIYKLVKSISGGEYF